MSETPEAPARPLSDDELAGLRRDGAIMVKGLLSEHWVKTIDRAVSAAMANPSRVAAIFSNPESGFQMEVGLVGEESARWCWRLLASLPSRFLTAS